MERRFITAIILSILFLYIYQFLVYKKPDNENGNSLVSVNEISTMKAATNQGRNWVVNIPEQLDGLEGISVDKDFVLNDIIISFKSGNMESFYHKSKMGKPFEHKMSGLGKIFVKKKHFSERIVNQTDTSYIKEIAFDDGSTLIVSLQLLLEGKTPLIKETLSYKASGSGTEGLPIYISAPQLPEKLNNVKSRYMSQVLSLTDNNKPVKLKAAVSALEKYKQKALDMYSLIDGYKIQYISSPTNSFHLVSLNQDNMPLFGMKLAKDAENVIYLFAGLNDKYFLQELYKGDLLFSKGLLSRVTDLMRWLLSQIHGIVKSWALSILIFAVVFILLFMPLNIKSFISMKKLQKIQPEMKRLQEQYKGDNERLNRELLLLYQRERVNPFSGCLPMLIQLPVFFALYPVLLNNYEIQGEGFLWVRDLTAPDVAFAISGFEVHLLPIILAFLFLAQQLFTMQNKELPEQQKIMVWIMPIIFLLIFYSMPSGMVLFWLVLSIGNFWQQYYVTRLMNKN